MGGDDSVAAQPPPSWLRTLARWWCLRAAGDRPLGKPAAPIAALAAILLAAWVVIDRWQRQPDPVFSADGCPYLAWYVLALLGLAALLEWRATPRPAGGSTLVLALALAPVPLLLMSVGMYLLEERGFWCLSAVAAVYALVFLARGLRTLTGRPQFMAALFGVIFVAGVIEASDALNVIPDLWNPREANEVSEDQLADREAALFEEADRIDAALELVQRGTSSAPQGFFLGFAGVGDEKVFAQEIGLAARVLGERFGIGDRHLSLINDERDLERAPIASVSGLNYALQGLAARMDLDKDVLFLAISSHGSDEPVIAVSNSQLPLQSLTPQELAESLKDAGIQWRVIIISACYAGGFVDSLKGPKSIIITAAAADRTSFGCSSDSDLTYFGEAFYRDALPEALSLRDAFAAAKKAIATRELNEHETPSNPQADFGTEMEPRLKMLGR